MKKIVFLSVLAINFSFNMLAQNGVNFSDLNKNGEYLRFMTKDEELNFTLENSSYLKATTCAGAAAVTVPLVDCADVGTAQYTADNVTTALGASAATATVPATANAGAPCSAYSTFGNWLHFNPAAGVTTMNFLLQAGSTVANGNHTMYAQFFQGTSGAACPALTAMTPCQKLGGAAAGVLTAELLYITGIDDTKDVWIYVWDDSGKSFNLNYKIVGSAPSTNTSCAGASTNSSGCNVGAPPATWGAPASVSYVNGHWFDPPTSMFDAVYSVCDGGNWGSNENTIYFSFTASSTTGSIGVSGITCNGGVAGQAQFGVFNSCACLGTYTAACYKGCAVGSGTLDLAGLTPGVTYIIAVDGFAGDDCKWNFTTTGIILPVELMDVRVVDLGYGNKVYWTSATERNCEKYIIERSIDGEHFEYLDEIKGAGNSSSPLDYSILDPNPSVGYNYYRLKQVDVDGTEFLYMPLMILNKAKGLIVSPNPVSSEASVRFGSNAKVETSVKIYDTFGRLVYSNTIEAVKGENNFSFSTEKLSEGVYTLEVKNNNQVNNVKFIKE